MTTAFETTPDAWKEVCAIGIIPEDSSELQFAGLTEDISGMDFGEKDIEGVPLVNGGRVVKFTPMGDESITMKMYPVTADVDGTGTVQLFHPTVAGTAWSSDEADPIEVLNSFRRRKFGIILLWATVLPAAASTTPVVNIPAYRIQVINAYMTVCKPSFDDKTKTAEVTFKWAPFQKDGSANKREDSTAGATQLNAGISSAITF